jgi:hypothetical protein
VTVFDFVASRLPTRSTEYHSMRCGPTEVTVNGALYCVHVAAPRFAFFRYIVLASPEPPESVARSVQVNGP